MMKGNAQPLWTELQLAKFLNKSIHSLRRDRRMGQAPPHVRVNGSIRYRPETVEAWLMQRTVVGGSESPRDSDALEGSSTNG
jgi:hypothetical protein